MKIKIISILSILAILLFIGCKDVLDKRDLEALDENIWNDEVQATLFLNGLYTKAMPTMGLGNFSGFTEESYTGSSTVTDLLYGITNDDARSVVAEMSVENYNLIRQINICIEGVEGGSLDDEIKGQIAGQAYFLRAFKHWNMVKYYGGVSIINNVQDPYSDDLDVPRHSTKESIDLLVADLDHAIEVLPIEYNSQDDFGRITKGIAAAFKGRILLFWASPQFNRENKQDRWQAAYEANLEAVDYLSLMSTPRALHSDFSTVFTTDVASNPEAVFFRNYNGTANYSSGWEGSIRPASGGGSSGQKPTWELVKSFPMINGLMPSEPNSGFDSTMFWLNRDKRFYNTVSYTGDQWEMNGRITEVGGLTTNYIATYPRYNGIEDIRSSINQGFLCKKANDPSVNRATTGNTSTTWHELRYAEVLLNLAESANEVGEVDVMMDNLQLIRKRAGIDSGGDGNYGLSNLNDKEWMREVIMNERLVEFAYEGKRYWDLRRRLMYRNDLGEYTKKLNGRQRHTVRLSVNSSFRKRIPSGIYKGLYAIDTAIMNGYFDLNSLERYNELFTREYVSVDSPTASSDGIINYRELYDFFCIPGGILDRSPAVEQTLGWLFGTFDPLAE